jgi:hypothetical protein
MTTPARVAVGVGAVALVVLVLSAGAPIRALLTPAPRAPAEPGARDSTIADAIERRVARIDGRSLFFVPAEPPPPPPPAVARDDSPPGPPPPPSTYRGPGLVAMINGVAWFSDGTRLAPADEADGDLRVVRLVPPWEAVVEWRGAEFTVSLFERDRVVLPDREPASAGRDAGDEPLALSPAETSSDTTEDTP